MVHSKVKRGRIPYQYQGLIQFATILDQITLLSFNKQKSPAVANVHNGLFHLGNHLKSI